VINYINPTAANGLGIRIFAPTLKSFALCDGLHMPHVKARYAARAGITEKPGDMTPEIDAAFDFRIAGPNHFTWLVKADYDGKDVAPAIAESLRREAATETDGGDQGAKAKFNATIGYELYKAFGYVPTCVAHTKEYVRFWQGLGTTPEPIEPLSVWDAAARYPRHVDMWDEVDGYNYGTAPVSDFMEKTGPDHATDIVETMVAGLKKPFFINQANKGAITNMPDDAFVEILCHPTMGGLEPLPIGDAPVGLRGLWQQVLDAHELSARAAMSGDRDLLYRAFLCDPLVSSLADSRAMIDELLEAEKDALPAYWFG
jgi:alpha-galactosidase